MKIKIDLKDDSVWNSEEAKAIYNGLFPNAKIETAPENNSPHSLISYAIQEMVWDVVLENYYEDGYEKLLEASKHTILEKVDTIFYQVVDRLEKLLEE